MKINNFLILLLIPLLIFSCQTNERDSEPNEVEETITPLDAYEATKNIFGNLISGADSVTFSETDSLLYYGAFPETDEFDIGKEIYGTFIINKNDIYTGDLNGDRLDDVVVKYTFVPYMENNELTYYKVLIQENGMLLESGEIFGGGRCEGPILEKVSIKKRVIQFSGFDFADGDPCCCPTIEVNEQYQIVENKLSKIN